MAEEKKDNPVRRAQVEDADYVLTADEPNVPRVREEPASGGLAMAAVVMLCSALLLAAAVSSAGGYGRGIGREEPARMTLSAAGETPVARSSGGAPSVFGIEAEDISAPVAEYYRRKGRGLAEGVGVYAVTPGGAADGLLCPGDVITAVNGREIKTCTELAEAARSETGELTLTVIRDGERAQIVLRPGE